MNNQISKSGLSQNFYYGGISGLLTGFVVGIPEALKVYFMAVPPGKRTFDMGLFRTMGSLTPSFASLFSGVCALEFSVNDEIKKDYGVVAGTAASAATGAALLTPADYLMLRKFQNKSVFESLGHFRTVGISCAFTGFTPMVGREVFFTASVMALGPAVARQISGKEKPSDGEMFAGRVISGVPMTILSQPFDAMKTQMQKIQEKDLESGSKPTQSVLVRAFDYFCKNPQAAFRGTVPRLGLATTGGAIAGGIYTRLKESAEASENKLPRQSLHTNK